MPPVDNGRGEANQNQNQKGSTRALYCVFTMSVLSTTGKESHAGSIDFTMYLSSGKTPNY